MKRIAQLYAALAPLIAEYGADTVIATVRVMKAEPKGKGRSISETRAKVMELRQSGLGPTEIARQLGRSVGRIAEIVHQEERKNWGINTNFADLDLSMPVYNALMRAGLETIDEAILVACGSVKIRNLGPVGVSELRDHLLAKGYLSMERNA